MTTLTETPPQSTGTWIESDEHLAHNLAAGLYAMANMVAACPEIAPVIAGTFRNLMVPVGSDPDGAARTVAGHGGAVFTEFTRDGRVVEVSNKVLGQFVGTAVEFGPAVHLWFFMENPQEPVAEVPAEVPVEPEPEVQDPDATLPGVPDDGKDSEPVAEVPAETAVSEVAAS